MPKNLIFLFDGSSNTIISPKRKRVSPTNMYYLNQAISSGTSGCPQISFYLSGVGTHGDAISAASGEGLDEIVVDAYTNLASNYSPGDRIYLFGFSRGAVAARALSALVSDPGLLKDTRLAYEFPGVWKYYLERNADVPSQATLQQLRDSFKPSIWPKEGRASIDFIGVFDAVPGYKWDRRKMFTELRIRNDRLDRGVKAAVQLLSIDDRRLPSFEPLVWGSVERRDQYLRQIWMPGVHADVGGSGEGVFIGRVALLTMIDCLRDQCKELDIDDDFYRDFFDETMNFTDEFVISNERSKLSFLLRTEVRKADKAKSDQYLHELADFVICKEIRKHGKRRQYLLHESLRTLPRYKTQFSTKLKETVNNIVS